MKLISSRTSLYTLKQLIATKIALELTDQKDQLEAIATKNAFQTYYYKVLSKYFVEDDNGVEGLNLFVDRFTAPEEAEVPMIILNVEGDENSENGTSAAVDVEVSFEIACFDKSGAEQADTDASDKTEFITGVIRNILETIQISGIKNKRVTRRKFSFKNNEDASNVTYSSVIFTIKYIEEVFISKNLVDLEQNKTTLRGRFQLYTNNLGG